MKPNDENGKLPLGKRPFRVLIISGSDRRQYNCPGVDSKSRTLMLRMAEHLPQEWENDMEDLGNVFGRERIQSCNACVSTSMALCCWPCNCYSKGNKYEPDLMWNLDLYSRLDLADAAGVTAQTIVKTAPGAIVLQGAKVAIHRARVRVALGQQFPLASAGQEIEHGVEGLA